MAWIANRAGLLSACFGLLSLFCYTHYLRKPLWKWYLAVVAAFSLSLMVKPMLVTFPFLLIPIDFWPADRWKLFANATKHLSASDPGRIPRTSVSLAALLRGKTPLILLSAASVVLTLVAAQKVRTPKLPDLFPLDVRITNSLQAYVLYIKKLLWPAGLALPYPHPGHYIPEQAVAAGLMIAAVSLIVITKKGITPTC